MAAVTLPNSEEWELIAPDNYKYKIQASWPLKWKDRSGHKDVPVLYILDGNSAFLTATEAAWRRASAPQYAGGGLIVSIGHEIQNGFLFMKRRNLDLTPPTSEPKENHGGANAFLHFLETKVKPFVRSTILPESTVGREALFGHSYGGLFTLYTMFNSPSSFDCYFAGSPSSWYENSVLLDYEKKFRERKGNTRPTLVMFYGGLEQNPYQRRGETDEAFQKRRAMARSWAVEGASRAMAQRLENSGTVAYVLCKDYAGEDHGTVIACGLSRAVAVFYEDWPINEEIVF